ncbi:hypothetical protein ACHAO1_009724 [Botrytis cinerea]
MGAQVIPPETTSTALVVSKPQNKNGPRVKDLILMFEKLGKEIIYLCERKHEENIQRALPEKERAFTDYLSSKFSEIADNANEKIQEINAELGLDLPLEKPREISATHIDENNQKFITAEREINAIQKEHLRRNFNEFNLGVSTILEISAIETTPSFIQLAESPDDTVEIAHSHEENCSLKKALEDSRQTLVKLKAEKEDENDVLKRQIQHYKVIAKSCSRVRRGFYNSGRRFYHDGEFHNIEGRAPALREVNDRRNDACHRGDIATDYALFKVDLDRTGWNVTGQYYVDFTNSYHVTPHEWGKIYSVSRSDPHPVLIEVLNMNATLYHCYSNTKYSHCKADDDHFNEQFAKLFAKFKHLLEKIDHSQAIDRYKYLVIFVKNAVKERKVMEEIVGKTIARERARNFNRA